LESQRREGITVGSKADFQVTIGTYSQRVEPGYADIEGSVKLAPGIKPVNYFCVFCISVPFPHFVCV